MNLLISFKGSNEPRKVKIAIICLLTSLKLTGFALPKLPLLHLRAIITDFSLTKLSIPTCLSQKVREGKEVQTISQSEPY